MKKNIKKIIVVVLIASILALLAFSLIGCSNNQGEPLKVVFLGDSIAEAIAGSAIMQAREKTGYYGLIGVRNNYTFINRAVSGSMTHAMLNFIQQEDNGARMHQTHIKEADVLSVSILGNDFLLNDITNILYNVHVLNNLAFLENILKEATKNFSEIVRVLKELNPTAALFFKTVYNPIFWGSPLLNENQIIEWGLTNNQTLRPVANALLSELNAIIFNYLEKNPGAFYIIDTQKEFERIYQENPARGERLIFGDGVHPSPEGHAIIANLFQEKLQELSLAAPNPALSIYKGIRNDLLNTYFTGTTVNISQTQAAINNATSFSQVTLVYFDAIHNVPPIIPRLVPSEMTPMNRGTVFSTELVFDRPISLSRGSVAGLPQMLLFPDSSITLRPDGTATIRIVPIDIESLFFVLEGLTGNSISQMLGGMDLSGVLYYFYDYFPGGELAAQKMMREEPGKVLGYIEKMTGLSFTWDDPDGEAKIFNIIRSIGQSEALPHNIQIPGGIAIELNARYFTEEVYSSFTDTTHTAVYLYTFPFAGEPYIVMTLTNERINNRNVQVLQVYFTFEVIEIELFMTT